MDNTPLVVKFHIDIDNVILKLEYNAYGPEAEEIISEELKQSVKEMLRLHRGKPIDNPEKYVKRKK